MEKRNVREALVNYSSVAGSAAKELKEMGIMGLDYHYSNFEQHPEWVKEAHDLGMIVNVWTVNKEDMMKKMIDLNVDYITTDKPEEALKLVK